MFGGAIAIASIAHAAWIGLFTNSGVGVHFKGFRKFQHHDKHWNEIPDGFGWGPDLFSLANTAKHIDCHVDFRNVVMS